ncbi:MAG: ribonuclease Z [Oscillospiraceae bacterium]|nr:ribonuclease Z [Oscillospiraceae bacterium]
MLDVCLPGTGGMLPLPNRWLTCCWIEHQGAAILIDCGEGTQIALKKAGLKPARIELLLITHFHADHVSGLPGILLTLANSARTQPLTIAGPVGLKRIVSALTVIAPRLPFPLEIIELQFSRTVKSDQPTAGSPIATSVPCTPKPLYLQNVGGHDAGYRASSREKTSPVKITALPLRHGVNCLGYRIELSRKPVFNPDKAKSLDVPVKFYKHLHSGESVTLDNGRIILPEQVLDGIRRPISVCYFTDTKPFPQMIDFAKDVDLLISEGMYYDERMREKIDEKNHMLFSDSAKLASKCGAKRLWLTHYSPALERPHDGTKAVQKIFPQTTISNDGEMLTIAE